MAGRIANMIITTTTVAPNIAAARATADPSSNSPVPGAVTALTPNCMAPSKAAALPARCALVSSATC